MNNKYSDYDDHNKKNVMMMVEKKDNINTGYYKIYFFNFYLLFIHIYIIHWLSLIYCYIAAEANALHAKPAKRSFSFSCFQVSHLTYFQSKICDW